MTKDEKDDYHIHYEDIIYGKFSPDVIMIDLKIIGNGTNCYVSYTGYDGQKYILKIKYFELDIIKDESDIIYMTIYSCRYGDYCHKFYISANGDVFFEGNYSKALGIEKSSNLYESQLHPFLSGKNIGPNDKGKMIKNAKSVIEI